ncbi:hypothetical protein Nepgr_003900 [Nepenthes gracilis]|uniref:Uncharacterized protein n=1 Tax=Nepenthes gracilis TaxID=150966 RepID=A0AAD3S0H7_NEPGR|nr:hypothetical protein Nepgr_003900 [Nepenthes gracilis]
MKLCFCKLVPGSSPGAASIGQVASKCPDNHAVVDKSQNVAIRHANVQLNSFNSFTRCPDPFTDAVYPGKGMEDQEDVQQPEELLMDPIIAKSYIMKCGIISFEVKIGHMPIRPITDADHLDALGISNCHEEAVGPPAICSSYLVAPNDQFDRYGLLTRFTHQNGSFGWYVELPGYLHNPEMAFARFASFCHNGRTGWKLGTVEAGLDQNCAIPKVCIWGSTGYGSPANKLVQLSTGQWAGSLEKVYSSRKLCLDDLPAAVERGCMYAGPPNSASQVKVHSSLGSQQSLAGSPMTSSGLVKKIVEDEDELHGIGKLRKNIEEIKLQLGASRASPEIGG